MEHCRKPIVLVLLRFLQNVYAGMEIVSDVLDALLNELDRTDSSRGPARSMATWGPEEEDLADSQAEEEYEEDRDYAPPLLVSLLECLRDVVSGGVNGRLLLLCQGVAPVVAILRMYPDSHSVVVAALGALQSGASYSLNQMAQVLKDKEYDEVVEGRRYRIIERAFAIIAQQSGTFTIEGPLFEGEVIDNSRQSFGFFNRNKAVNRVGPSQNITVFPIPSNYDQHWLPSDFVQLDDEWQGNTREFIAGEPITRTITLTAIGVVEEQLPQITNLHILGRINHHSN
jgi:hypothetical protein